MQPDPRWTPETEELVAQAEYGCDMAAEESDDFEPIEWQQALLTVRGYYLKRAAAGLTALADAGLLLPVGGEVRECWRDYDTVSGGSAGFDSLARAVEWRERHSKPLVPWGPPPHPTVTQVCSITTWPDGSVHTGPWRPVDPEGVQP